ncbi:MJ0042 family finger-like protein [hydrothermal vent metagenome]|uniref:MJ0042 family finger-like protein n=1 Tax=hydrothermal vent metagenome TaxID=652676 RepID=A0A1W1BWL3_9ZZZZ
MIIYNHKKEFVGIEKKDLQALKLESLAELQNEVFDFADLFVKTPGYIHNFKHVHWLDFIASADAIDENRVIISVKGRNFKAVLDVHSIYLVDEPQKEGYGIVLNALRELTKEESERISGDLAQRTVQKPSEVKENLSVSEDKEPELEPEPETPSQEEEIIDDIYATNENEDEPLTLEFDDDEEEVPLASTEVVPEEPLKIDIPDEDVQEEPVDLFEDEEDDKFRDYRFDPEFAAKELGLPLDLVEEFIQDFIAQAEEFKPQLYKALEEGQIDNLRMLSHKLKGVAANLRIEDAYDALVTINTSDDMTLVKRKLDRFYKVILKKIAGEEVEVQTKPQNPPKEEQQEESISIDLEQDSIEAPIKEESTQISSPLESQEEKIELSLDDEDVFLSSQKEEKDEKEEELKLDEVALDDEIKLELEEDKKEEPLTLEISQDEKEEEMPLTLDIEEDKQEEEISIDLEEKKSESQEEAPLEISLDDETEEITDPTLNSDEIESITINIEEISSKMGIAPNLYEELFSDYISDMQEGISQLEELLISGNKEAIDKLALRLKGMSENMYIDIVAKELEEFITREDSQRVELLNRVKRQIDSIKRV